MAQPRVSLRVSMPVSITTALPYGHAVERLNRVIARSTPWAAGPEYRLAGSVEGDRVRLYLTRRGFRTGRSWSVELRGQLRPIATGTELVGSIGVGGARFVRAFLWLWRMGVLGFVLFGTVATLAAHNDYSPLAFAVVFLSLLLIGAPFIGFSILLEWIGNRRATRDAEILEQLLRNELPEALPS